MDAAQRAVEQAELALALSQWSVLISLVGSLLALSGCAFDGWRAWRRRRRRMLMPWHGSEPARVDAAAFFPTSAALDDDDEARRLAAQQHLLDAARKNWPPQAGPYP